jgi:hypothetical protein
MLDRLISKKVHTSQPHFIDHPSTGQSSLPLL